MLSNAFGELFSSDVLEDTTIINLETSRTHDDDFHDYYVQLLTEVGVIYRFKRCLGLYKI